MAAQPLNSVVEMRVVISPRAEARAVVDRALYQGRLITDYVMFNFWIRAKTPGQAQPNSRRKRWRNCCMGC